VHQAVFIQVVILKDQKIKLEKEIYLFKTVIGRKQKKSNFSEIWLYYCLILFQFFPFHFVNGISISKKEYFFKSS
jgi:hypothetical protein